ncbi:MAG: hypothetical protein K9K32_05760 [Halanaerobiales bacterium]|nr:hypothetical protein [Halanaerobiales bacterium]
MTNIVKENRVGKFYIDTDMLEEEPNNVRKVLSEVLIARAECIYHKGQIEYVGYSKHFESVESIIDIPVYDVIITCDTTGIVDIDFKRVDY